MPNYKILLEGENVFNHLRTAAGSTLEAAQGEVVRLLEEGKDEFHDFAVAAHLEAKTIEATDEAVTVKVVAPVVEKSEDELKAEADLVAKTLADEKAAAEAAAQQALLDAQKAADAVKAKADAEAAGNAQQPAQ